MPSYAPTAIFDTYWKFAAERQAIYHRRLVDPVGPWTNDRILSEFRFTNAYRAADRVSQYLIREVQYGAGRSQHPVEVVFRTLLFKLFNKIETWEALEDSLGPITWQAFDGSAAVHALDKLLALGERVYSAAYIMPSPNFGQERKHANHLALLNQMMMEGLPGRVEAARSLSDLYHLLLSYPGIGPFLAFQYAIDLGYSEVVDWQEEGFVVAGPGALDGIAKCFRPVTPDEAAELILDVCENQEMQFERLGISFETLFGRRLQPIDCQNLFCEISKYTRASNPEVMGTSGRTRIKQKYRQNSEWVSPFFPPKWALDLPHFSPPKRRAAPTLQLELF